MENSADSGSYCQTMDGLARWFGGGVSAAFFASLDQCSCVNVDADGEDDIDEEAHDHPLMFTTFDSFSSSTTASTIPPSAAAANLAVVTPPAVQHPPV